MYLLFDGWNDSPRCSSWADNVLVRNRKKIPEKISWDEIENKWIWWKISNFGEFIGYEKKDESRYIKNLPTKWKAMKEIKRLKEYNLVKERKRFSIGRK